MAPETDTGPSIVERIRDWARDVRWVPTEEKLAYVDNVEQLPPGTDGRQYRYEIAVKLDDSIGRCPSEEHIRDLADTTLEKIQSVDNPDWVGVDELYIQVYSPNRETGKGACGTAHWVDGSYESIDTREYLF